MAMKLPTYNQPGWGATLNNYLRELNQRISKVEANNGSSSNGVGQVFGASAFNTGLTSTTSTCEYNGVEKYSTFKLGENGLDELSFTGEYFISQSTVEGNAFLGKLDDADWGSNIANLDSNQVMLICADEDRTLHIIPFTQAKNNRELDYNLCRLGYLTKIDDSHIYFTPCPNLATMDLHDKYNYIMRPTFKSNDSEKPQITVGSYSYMMEGLNYYKHFENQNKANTTPLQVLDGELYNVHTFANVVAYFLIQKNATGKEVIVRECSSEELENHINGSGNNKIFIFYVTIAGIIFVREISLKDNEQVVDSTSLANFLVNTEFEENNALFYYYSWLKPLELKRCGKDPFGNLRWHMASYNGISPQIVGTPIHTVDTNYYWADNYLLQIDNSDESARNYYGLRIRPYVQLKDNGEEENYPNIANPEKTNEYVVLNVSDKSTPESDETKPGLFLYNYPFREHLYFGGTVLSKDNDKVIFEIRNTGLYDSDYHLFFKKGIEAPLKIEGNDLSNISIYNKYLIGNSESRQESTLNLNWDTGVAYFKAAQVKFSTDTTDSVSKAAFLISDSKTDYYKLLIAKDSDWKVIADNINNPIYKYTGNHKKLKIYFTVAVTDKYTGTNYSPLAGFQEFTFPHTTSIESPLVFTSSEGFTANFYYNDTTQEFQIISFTTPSSAMNVTGVYFKKFEYYQESFNHSFEGNTSIKGDVSVVGRASFSSSLTAGNSKFKVTSEGNCSATDFTVTSDERYKNLHSQFTNSGLNIINQLPIYNYSLKIQPDKETIGITAQDLLQVLPQLVDTSDESHYKINESKLVYVCMQAIKELNNQIKILKQEISDLRGN